MSPPTPEASMEQDILEAHQMHELVKRGEVKPEQASEANEEEFDAMLQELFDKKYTQNLYRPREIHEKAPGQRAEDILIEIINRHPFFHARHGTQREDQEEKIDIVLEFEGESQPIPIQVTAKTDANDLRQKMRQLSMKTLLIILPPVGRILDAYEQGNKRDIQLILEDFLKQIFTEMARVPTYRGVYHHLQERLLQTHQ